MISPIVAVLTVLVSADLSGARPVYESVTVNAESTAAADSLAVSLFNQGVSFEDFLASARARRGAWSRNWEESEVPAEVLARARAVSGEWRILVVAIDACSDSVNTIPYLARLVELHPGLEMRIVLPGPGAPIMERHRTPDGRAATPTVVIIDSEGREVGQWVERPAELQQMAMDAREKGELGRFQNEKQQWYDTDRGVSTIREVLEVIEKGRSQ